MDLNHETPQPADAWRADLQALTAKVDAMQATLLRIETQLRSGGAQAPAPEPPMPAPSTPPPPRTAPVVAPQEPVAPPPVEETAIPAMLDRFPAAPPARPNFLQRWAKEGKLAIYLLSFAAALMVLLAGATGLALVWNSIPDVAKVLGVAGVGLGLTGLGTWMARTGVKYQAATATVMGTGGGLTILAIVGAALLYRMLPAVVAFALLAACAALLIVLATWTRVYSTVAVAALGAGISLGLAAGHAAVYPGDAFLALVLMTLLVVILGVVLRLCSTKVTHDQLRLGYGAVGLALTLLALALAPMPLTVVAPAAMTTAFHLMLALVAFTQFALLLVNLPERFGTAAVLGWVLLPLGVWLLFSRLAANYWVYVQPTGLYLIVLVAIIAVAVVMTVVPVSWVMRLQASWSFTCATLLLVFTMFNGRTGLLSGALLLVTGIVAIAFTALPALRVGAIHHVLVFATCPLATLLFGPGLVISDLAWLWLSVALGAALTLGFEQRRIGEVDAAFREVNRQILQFAGLILSAVAVAAVPWLIAWSVVVLTRADGAWWVTVHSAGSLAIAGVLLYLGLGTVPLTALDLFTGRGVRQFPTALPRVLFGIVVAADCAIAMVTAGLYTLPGVTHTLVVTPAMAVLTLAALGQLYPYVRNHAVALLFGATVSLSLGAVTTLLTRDTGTSLPLTLVLMISGALTMMLGFRTGAVYLRHYGLAVVLLMVFKLATWDITTNGPLAKVLALLLAGLICFGLSLLYARFSAQATQEEPQGDHPEEPAPGE